MTDGEQPFILETVRSVVDQTVPCAILILVADNNTWIEPTLGELAARVTIKRIPFQRLGLVRNLGVQEATTEWIAFVDGDDVWLPEKNERQLAFAQRSGFDAVGARHVLIRTDGTPYFYAFARTQPMPSAWIAKRELLFKEPFTDLAQWEDAELWKRFKRLGVCATMKAHLILYRVREGSMSSNFSPAKRRKQLFARLSAHNPMRWLIRCGSWMAAQVLTPPSP